MGLRAAIAIASLAFMVAGAGRATPLPPPKPETKPVAKPAHGKPGQKLTRASLCLMVESAARANGLPIAFLTRVIWRESRFDPMAVGPVTRSGPRAEGIAQFMPGTAADRALADPFDPVQALPEAAAYLRELAERFGNLGLAAAAYNAGPRRVDDWLAGSGHMPGETRSYVLAITGRSVEDWAKPPKPVEKAAQKPGKKDNESLATKPAKKTTEAPRKKKKPMKPAGCETTLASLDQPPGPFAFELNRRVGAAIAKPWGVELAAGFSRVRVLASYARAMRRLSSLIGDQDPIVTRALIRSRGSRLLYQARIGADTRAAAHTLCARIRRAGGACLVLRTRH
jgi:hypothetical protein